jgi:uncharacterized membrane protein
MTRSGKQHAPVASKDPLARLAERQRWISPGAEESLQNSVSQALQRVGGDSLRHALHGGWLHEPLHAILTDVPIGSWTATIAFDSIAALSSSSKLDSAADAAVVVGLVGAAGAAITGLNDWSEIREPAARKIGLIHALLNVAATGLFVSSCIARTRRARTSGRALAAIAYLFVSASAHLGGNLVYEHGIGVAPRPGDVEVTQDLQS